jgi:FixJ family two-component response regulator
MSTGSSKSPLISIVDDDPFVRQATDSLLQSLGYRTSTFASAEDFLRSSYIHEMNCLISDVQMPGLSGVDLQRVLIAQGNHMPTIFISAYFEERIRQSVIEAGAIGCLRKPFDDESLIEILQWALGSEWTFGNCSRNRMSAIQRIQELDWERTTLFEQAKQEALQRANQAVEDLNALGLKYRLVTGAAPIASTKIGKKTQATAVAGAEKKR